MGVLTTDPLRLILAGLLFAAGCGGGSGGIQNPADPNPLNLLELAPAAGLGTVPPPTLFSSDTPLKFVLAADFDALRKDRDQETEERPAQILLVDETGAPVVVPIELKTRGNFRLKRSTCQDPPLRLNLPETQASGTVFDGQDKLKLVTHCRNSDRYEQNLLEEYLAYRIYNQLTDLSFRVQLAEVTYVDTGKDRDTTKRMAFLIEDEDSMAARLGGMMIETPTSNPGDFDQMQLGLMYLFQYMVGNVDWGTGTSHNVNILLKDRSYYPIPYDFDWTGLVDAPYAGPNELTQGRHSSVRERVYWGACSPEIDYEALFAWFAEKKPEISALPLDLPGLNPSNAKSASSYLDDFYRTIEDPRKADREIKRQCRREDGVPSS
jgi:hypothetical protein